MSVPLLRTKLYRPPPRTDLVPRPHLVERLHDGLRLGRKLTLVSAPAGFGKTTLVTQWLQQADRPFAWLALDEADNDPVRFLGYLVGALQTVSDGLGASLQGLLQSRPLPPTGSALPPDAEEQWIETLMSTLLNDLASSPSALALVLDDYHLIRHPLVHEAIRILLERQPAQMHLVMITREEPPLPLGRLRVRSELTEIRERDLRFSEREATAFFGRRMGLALPGEAVATLEARTEGWVAGLQLAALSLQGRESQATEESIASFGGGHHYVAEYLAQEVLQRQPEDVREFLCDTAVLARLNAGLCDAVTGRSDSRTILARLERANLFLIPLDDTRGWYRYHHLFRDFLLTRLHPQQRARLHRLAARWHEANGMVSEAVAQVLEAEDLSEAARVIGNASRQAVELGQIVSVLDWMARLPDELVRSTAELATFKAWALCLTGRREAADSYAESAEEALAADAPRSLIAAQVVLRGYLAVQRGDHLKATSLAEKAMGLVGESERMFRNAALLTLGHAQIGIGDTQAAILSMQRAVESVHRRGNQLAAMGALEELVLLLHQHGRPQEAADLCRDSIRESADARGITLPIASLPTIMLGMLHYEADELTEAHQLVMQGLELCRQMAMPSVTLRAKIILARLQQASGRGKAALALVQEARELGAVLRSPRYTRFVESAAADLSLRQGNVAFATLWAESAGLSAADVPHPARELEYLTLSRLLLAQGRPAEAERVLAELERAALDGERHGSRITIRVLQALAHRAQGREAQALSALEEAVRLASPRGYLRAFLDEDPAVLSLLPRVRDAAPDLVDRLLRHASAGTAHVGAPCQPLIEPLSDREIEVLRLVASGPSNREAAQALFVTEGTIKKHLSHIFGKLGVKSRTQAVARAKEMGLLN
jgi:LuxR family transcriptional regulator, maltose regulon positive regulatory protein